MPAAWRAAVRVVSVDPHEGYRSAITTTPLLAEVSMVVDPFHIVRLANQALTKCRQRVQQATLGHRGWKRDPLYAMRKLFLLGAERVDDAGWHRIWSALRDGDPDGEVTDCWVAKEKVRDIYLTDDVVEAERALDDAIDWCSAPEASVELRRLAKTLRRWRREIVAHHTTGASNGPVEAANLLIKQVKRSGRGFRNFENYRLRILLAGGLTRERHTVTRLRARPSSVA
jgi:transposase